MRYCIYEYMYLAYIYTQIFEYRKIIEKKHRIIYQLANPNIFVFGIIHGSRNIGEVLRQRLLL